MKFSIRDLLPVTAGPPLKTRKNLMKPFVCSLVLAAAVVSVVLGDEPEGLSGGETYVCRLSVGNWISTIPDSYRSDWDASSENPPVSAKKALKLSREVAERLAKKDKALDGWTCELDGATLKTTASTKKRWFWKVTYTWSRGGIGTGIPPYADIIVLMDGKVIEPKPDDDRLVK